MDEKEIKLLCVITGFKKSKEKTTLFSSMTPIGFAF
jgi:hypothetical protein